MEILSKLGIDWKLLLAQIVNFAILLFLLKKFLYKPLLTMLNTRRETIEKSLEQAKSIDDEMKVLEQRKAEVLAQAKSEADSIMEKTLKLAETKRQEAISKTKQDVAAVISEAKEKIEQERREALDHAKQELSLLVMQASHKVIEDISDKKITEIMAQKALKQVVSSK